jgi:hypothetical protein
VSRGHDLAGLSAHLERHRALPPEWATVRDPDRELRRLWEACEEPWVLLELIEPVVGRVPVVLAAVACVRLALGSAPDADPALSGAMDVVEAWARGACDAARVSEAQDRVGEVIEQHEGAAMATARSDVERRAGGLLDLAHACLYVAQIARTGCWPQHDDPDAFRALSHAAAFLGAGGATRLCAHARARLECPTVESLLAAHRGH